MIWRVSVFGEMSGIKYAYADGQKHASLLTSGVSKGIRTKVTDEEKYSFCGC